MRSRLRIEDEPPAFAWWVHDVIKKRDRIIAKVKSKHWQQTHKYGIRIPKTVQEALAIDKENGNMLWWDAIYGREFPEESATSSAGKWEQNRSTCVTDLFIGDFERLDCREKIYIIAGPEFGSEEGSIMIIRKALYGLKSSGAAFRAHHAETLYDLSYLPSKADPDVWIRSAVKENGFEYYEMTLVYVDDIMCISHDPKATMMGIQATFKTEG
ncbi:Reverse transcriptase (RNA-dependent DNA polymerase) [Fragilaria crotonensis]|nr:Reverse transcriptase (RNA-dependent DNA polymerase) [Fragilaria crotonensis]